VWRNALLTTISILPFATAASAQTPGVSAAQALDLTSAELRSVIAAFPGDNTDVKSIDAGKHVVDVWLEQRKPGETATTGANGTAHAELTEIYLIIAGGGMLVTGGTLLESRPSAALLEFPGGGTFRSPTYGGMFTGGVTRKVGPGDVIIMPPGTVHQWISVDQSGTLIYLSLRIDPEHRQTAGFVNEALKK
jgi:hypothetical protein